MGCCGKVNYVHGAVGVAKAVLHIRRAPEQVIAERRDLCRTCEHSRKHPFKKTASDLPLVSFCKLCKCVLHLKTMNADEQCPMNPPRWQKVIPEETRKA